jgi:outer membrane protein assembly factor BamB
MNWNGLKIAIAVVAGLWFFLPSSASADWIQIFGGPSVEYGESVDVTSDGSYVIAGFTRVNVNADLQLIKTASDGYEIWSRIFGGDEEDSGRSVKATPDGGCVVAGASASFGAGGYDFWLIKVDADGNEEWNRTFGEAEDESAYAVEQASDGGYIIAGRAQSPGSIWLVKTDANGNEQWNREIDGTISYSSSSVKPTIDGGYIVVGYGSSGGSFSDLLLVKIDSIGNDQWRTTYGSEFGDYGHGVQQTADGGGT